MDCGLKLWTVDYKLLTVTFQTLVVRRSYFLHISMQISILIRLIYFLAII